MPHKYVIDANVLFSAFIQISLILKIFGFKIWEFHRIKWQFQLNFIRNVLKLQYRQKRLSVQYL